MDDIIELSEIDITPNTPTNTSKSGGGLELLMNNKVKENTNKSSNSDTTVRLGENGHNRRLSCTITEIKGLADFYTKRFY